jgi:Ca2+-binding EF-hand superfamily protein
VDGSGTIDAGELTACMRGLGATLDEKGVLDMFSYAMMTPGGQARKTALTFKEFLLCLAIGSVLQLFPLFRAYSRVDLRKLVVDETAASAAAEPEVQSQLDAAAANAFTNAGRFSSTGSEAGLAANAAGAGAGAGAAAPPAALAMQGRHLVNALKLVLEAYILFDRDGSGTIDKNEVLAMVEEENKKAKAAAGKKRGEVGTSALLSRERWEELDWDSDGQITFKEFLFALLTWVGMDDEEGDAEADGAAAAGSTIFEAGAGGGGGGGGGAEGAHEPGAAGAPPPSALVRSLTGGTTPSVAADQEIDDALKLPEHLAKGGSVRTLPPGALLPDPPATGEGSGHEGAPHTVHPLRRSSHSHGTGSSGGVRFA